DFARVFINNYRLKPRRTANALARLTTGLLNQNIQLPADEAGGEIALLLEQQCLQKLQPLILDALHNVRTKIGAGSSGAGRIFERECLGVVDLTNELHGRVEIFVSFARKTDDKIA